MMSASDELSTSVHKKLAELVRSIHYEDLPSDVVRAAKRLILDSLGCISGGFNSAPAKAARDMTLRLGGRPIGVIVGTQSRTSPALAAFTNGTALRYLDFNASYSGRDPSKMSGIVPAVLAASEIEDRSGRALLTALVAGAEVQGRLSDFAGDPNMKQRGWHHTCNLQLGCAVAAAALLSENPTVIANSMSISTTHQNTLAQIQHGRISMIKATADGWVAKGGIEAAMLAACGVTGPDRIIEGHAGWATRVAGAVDYDGLLAPIDGEYRIARARIKAFSVVGPAQSAVQAAIDIREQYKVTSDEIRQVIIFLPDRVVNDPAASSPAKKFPENRETADHSFYYVVAAALVDGECGEGQFSSEKLASPIMRDLIEKTVLCGDPEFSASRSAGGAGVLVTLRDGTILKKRYNNPPGHPANPITDAQLARKYDTQMKRLFSTAQSEAIKSAVFELDHYDKISGFSNLLVGDNEF